MNVLNDTGLSTQISFIKAYVNQQIAGISSNGTAAQAVGDENGDRITTTYVSNSDVQNEAGGIPRFTAEGHLVLPSGIELY
jgi:hypothetical protein